MILFLVLIQTAVSSPPPPHPPIYTSYSARWVAPVSTPAADSASPSDSAVPVEIRYAEEAEYIGEEHRAVLTGSVHIVRDSMTLRADRVVLFLTEDEKALERAVAEGHVEIVDGNRRALADHAVYTEATGEIVLTGHPRLFDGGNRMRARRIRYHLQSRSMRAEGAVRGILIPASPR
ncbi:MAG: hypothetical protein D6679_10410 [Candidatus Hydrogenedentota bacterium]|nr:MAG: hypothetical protein D6679_10410 [Candidatus Hydrogenedentota bacterium]